MYFTDTSKTVESWSEKYISQSKNCIFQKVEFLKSKTANLRNVFACIIFCNKWNKEPKPKLFL